MPISLPNPRLTTDKLGLIADVPSQRREWIYEVCSNPVQCAVLLECEQMPARPIMGYARAALLRREGETLRVDYAPYRHVTRRIKLTEGTWRGENFKVEYERRELVNEETGEITMEPDPFEEIYVDAEKLPFLRLEGNPAKFPGFDALIYHIGDICRMTGAKPVGDVFRPTRIDAAIDYPVSIEHFGITASRKRLNWQARDGQEQTIRKRGQLETLMLGAPGTNRFRIYDKVKEVVKSKRKQDEERILPEDVVKVLGLAEEWGHLPITRVEAECRHLNKVRTDGDRKAQPIRSVRELVDLDDPFRSLDMADTGILTNPSDWKDTSFACLVQTVGLDAALKMMPTKTRSRWRERLGITAVREGMPKGQVKYALESNTTSAPLLHPSIVFEIAYRQALREVIPLLIQ